MYAWIAALGERFLRLFGVFFTVLFRPFSLLRRRLRKRLRAARAARQSAASREGRGADRRSPSGRTRAPASGRRPQGAAAAGEKNLSLWVIPAVSLLIAALTVYHFLALRPAIRVEAGDTLIGYAAAASDYLSARTAAEARIRCGGASFKGSLPDVTFRIESVSVSDYTTQEQMTDRLLANVKGDMTEACGVFVNGKFVGAARSEAEAEAIFKERLSAAADSSSGASCYYGEDVSYVPGLYPDTEECIRSAAELRSAARSLTVMTSRTETVNETVGFSVVEIPSRTLSVNTARTILEGENGMDQVTRVVTYADGQVVSSREVSRSTVVEPVAMRRLVGTKMFSMPAVQQFSSVTQLLWPVDGAYNINSDYSYRWGKFHYALDIGVGSAPGTSLGKNVLAAADGVVELATTHSSYGYYIILDHGNGMETLYGHLMEDSFKVRPGETVRQGQPIAQVGQTGYATGPHLHFEVRVNGNKVDPKLFLQQYKGIGY